MIEVIKIPLRYGDIGQLQYDSSVIKQHKSLQLSCRVIPPIYSHPCRRIATTYDLYLSRQDMQNIISGKVVAKHRNSDFPIFLIYDEACTPKADVEAHCKNFTKVFTFVSTVIE